MFRNYWIAIIAATVANVALGFVWYNLLFTGLWHALDPSAPNSTGLDASLAGGVVTVLLIVTGMAWVFSRAGVASLGDALVTALVLCIAFDSTVYAGYVFFAGARATTEAFYGAFDIVSFLLTGAMLSTLGPTGVGRRR